MAVAEMCKGRIAVHRSVAEELAEKLQALGCCEFIEQSGSPLDSRSACALRSKQRHVEELLADARFLLRLLEPFARVKSSALSKMLGDIPGITFSELAAKVNEDEFKAFAAAMREKERKMTECRAEISRIKGLLVQLTALESISYPLEFFTSGTDLICGAVYSFSKTLIAEVRERLATEFGGLTEYQEINGGEKDESMMLAVLYRREDQDRVQRIFSDLSAGRVDIPKDFALSADEERSKLENSLERAEKEESSLCEEIASSADAGLDMARCCFDYWTVINERLSAMISGLPTEDVFIWSFWVPKECLKPVEYTIRQYEEFIEFSALSPDAEDNIPTLLKNPAWSSCVEPLTLMFGTPTYGGVDPTSLMAPFFFLFLGMCFGDAGYGLIMSGILGYFMVKYQLSSTLRKFFTMITVGMVCSVAFGAITGSWFGDSVTAFPFLSGLIRLKDALQVLDPMNDPMTLLMISLALGFIQIIFGLFIAFSNNWRNGERFSALADQGGWIIFLCGLVLTGLSASGAINGWFAVVPKYLAILGALILVATQGRSKKNLFGKLFSGVMSLYNVTGYLGDVLSYSRLLALGLGSAAVGMVINLLAQLVIATPYIGIPLAVLIFVAGHTFSIAVNLLGAFIHSLRLQYVEFFGKFYNANGRDFKPLRNSAQFLRLVEERSAR
jgi:V/A-type H+-transporting ATPase subunit I